MTSADRALILEAEIFPDYHCVYLEDLDTRDAAQSGGTPCSFTGHSILVVTLTADDAIDNDVNVKVNIYIGTGTAALGERIYNGVLKLESGQLAVGNISDIGVRASKVALGPGDLQLQVFVDAPSAASVINVLIEPD